MLGLVFCGGYDFRREERVSGVFFCTRRDFAYLHDDVYFLYNPVLPHQNYITVLKTPKTKNKNKNFTGAKTLVLTQILIVTWANEQYYVIILAFVCLGK